MNDDLHAMTDSLDNAVEAQRDLVAQVKALNVSQSRLRKIFVVVVVAALASGIGVVVAVNASADAENVAEDVAVIVETQEADRALARITNCQDRNAAYRATREDISTVLFALAEVSEDPAEATVLAEELVGLLSNPEDVNTDCDEDGNTDGTGDYPGPDS